MPDFYHQHIIELCKQFNIEIEHDNKYNNAFTHFARFTNQNGILIPKSLKIGIVPFPFTEDWQYASALHEIGHVLTNEIVHCDLEKYFIKNGDYYELARNLRSTLYIEHDAWVKAMEIAKWWTAQMEARRVITLIMYINSFVATSKSPPDSLLSYNDIGEIIIGTGYLFSSKKA